MVVTLHLRSHCTCSHTAPAATKQRNKCWCSSCFLLYPVRNPSPRNTATHLAVCPSTSINPVGNLLHRPTQNFLSLVVLEPDKLTTDINHSSACKVIKQSTLASVTSLPLCSGSSFGGRPLTAFAFHSPSICALTLDTLVTVPNNSNNGHISPN